jgi:hypothetical protein
MKIPYWMTATSAATSVTAWAVWYYIHTPGEYLAPAIMLVSGAIAAVGILSRLKTIVMFFVWMTIGSMIMDHHTIFGPRRR